VIQNGLVGGKGKEKEERYHDIEMLFAFGFQKLIDIQ